MAQPDLITVTFASSATPDLVNDIPIQVDPSDPENKASWSQGFPQITMIDQLAGGLPPFGQDFNGVLKSVTDNLKYLCGGGLYKFDTQWIDEVGGYDLDSVLLSDDGQLIFRSKSNENIVNPNASNGSEFSDNWEILSSVEGIQRALVSIQHGIAGTQVRNNNQLDERYVQRTGYNPFNPNGTYSGLRAQSTTAGDVGALPLSDTTSYSRTLLSADNATQARGTLDVLRAGTANAEARTNAQNDSRFVAQEGYNAFNPSGNYGSLRARGTTAADVGAVPTSRTVSAGTGTTGGGNLNSDITISFDVDWGDGRYVQPSDSVTWTSRPYFINNTSIQATIGRTDNGDVRTTFENAGGQIGTLIFTSNGEARFSDSNYITRFSVDLSSGDARVRGDLQVDEDIQANGDLNIGSTSDSRLKRGVTRYDVDYDALDNLYLLRGFYNALAGEKRGQEFIGSIAQDIQRVFPHCVGEKDHETLSKTLTVDYPKLALAVSLAELQRPLKFRFKRFIRQLSGGLIWRV